MTAYDVVKFWIEAGEHRWFNKDAAFDGALAVRFQKELQIARLGAFDHWGDTPGGALGLVILLDQIPRNIHRGNPLAYASDKSALQLAKRCIAKSYHQKLHAPLSQWFIMPFHHSEDLDEQHRGVALFNSLGLQEKAHWAQLHLDIIQRFGRFPHRNPILGRTSTPAELIFLKTGGFSG
jgi:uncharacterized protein (DUF924 family)